MAIYALKPNPDKKWGAAIYNSLINGEARFGWSYVPTADLHLMKEKIENEGWNSLSSDEKLCWLPYLLTIQKDDYVVYVNTPTFGKCTLAKVTKPYYFKLHDDLIYDWGADGNHCFGVDIESIKTFDRNESCVHPALSRRLKLQGRYWQIYTTKEFDDLLECLKIENRKADKRDNIEFLKKDMNTVWEEIGFKIHHTHPGKELEPFVAKLFGTIPNAKIKINGSGWKTDYGADIIVSYLDGPEDFISLQSEKIMVVQVKSYVGNHIDTKAVDDIESAIGKFNANLGLIVSTAKSTEILEAEIQKASQRLNVPIAICDGPELAKLAAKYVL